jgi:hypothetical protein
LLLIDDQSFSSSNSEADDDDEDGGDPQVIPFQGTSVIDVEGHDVADDILIASALANTSLSSASSAREEFVEGTYQVRRSTDFVNEYAHRDTHGILADGGANNPNHLLGAFTWLFPYASEVSRWITQLYFLMPSMYNGHCNMTIGNFPKI